MTIPRLTRFGRISHTSHAQVVRMLRKDKAQLVKRRISRPSPAEKRKARHLAYRRAQRIATKTDDMQLHIAFLMGRGDRKPTGNPPGWRCPDGCTSRENPEPWCDAIGAHISKTIPSLPPSRGTTHGQLMQMYHESEQP